LHFPQAFLSLNGPQMEKTYETQDLIPPMLKLSDPCSVKVRITDKHVFLFVGQRDWQWNLETGEMVGAGTAMCASIESDAPPQIIQH